MDFKNDKQRKAVMAKYGVTYNKFGRDDIPRAYFDSEIEAERYIKKQVREDPNAEEQYFEIREYQPNLDREITYGRKPRSDIMY